MCYIVIMKLLYTIFVCFITQACSVYTYTQGAVERNAFWDETYQSIYSIQSVYQTSDAALPYYHPDTKGWVNHLYRYDGNLLHKEQVFSWVDELGDSAQGWIQSAPVHYRSGTKSLYYPLGTYGIIRNVETGSVKKVAIPKADIQNIFKYKGFPVYEEDGLVPVLEVLPSPNGDYVTVLHSVSVMVGNFGFIYIQAIGVFTGTGQYMGYITLDPWNGTDTNLGNFPEQYKAPALPNADPPAFQSYGAMPTIKDHVVFWKADSTGFYVLVNSLSHPNVNPPACEVTISSSSPPQLTKNNLNKVPHQLDPPTAGGGWAPASGDLSARLLAYEQYPDNPNRFRLFIYSQSP